MDQPVDPKRAAYKARILAAINDADGRGLRLPDFVAVLEEVADAIEVALSGARASMQFEDAETPVYDEVVLEVTRSVNRLLDEPTPLVATLTNNVPLTVTLYPEPTSPALQPSSVDEASFLAAAEKLKR